MHHPWPVWGACRYVEVDEEHGARLFYYFIESERNPAEDPLILWITGGPGCSALSGLLFEIGQSSFLPSFSLGVGGRPIISVAHTSSSSS